MMSNLFEYLDNTPTEELFVDTSRNKKLQINFDIIVPKVSCDCTYTIFLFIEKYLLIINKTFIVLGIDSVDSSGETHLQVDHNVYKIRLNLDGQPISDPEKSDGKIYFIMSDLILLYKYMFRVKCKIWYVRFKFIKINR